MKKLLIVGVVVLAGCGTKTVDPCSGQTAACLAVQVDGAQGVTEVDSLSVVVHSFAPKTFQQGDGDASKLPVAIALVFDTVPTGTIDVAVTGSLHGTVVGSGTGQSTVAAGQHQTIHVTLTPGASMGDMAVGDMSVSDGGPSVDSGAGDMVGVAGDMAQTYAPARLIAPLSTATVTQQQPTLHWQLGNAPGSVVVDLCHDRACTKPFAQNAVVGSGNVTAAPDSKLPAGWVFWRVRTVSGSTTISTSYTWQFYVPAVPVTTTLDTSNGTTFDINGDGYPDVLVGDAGKYAVFVYLGSKTGLSQTPIEIDSPTAGTGDSFANSVVNGGDLNGDGFDDLVVADNAAAGAVYVYWGSANVNQSSWNAASTVERSKVVTPSPSPGVTGAFALNIGGGADVNGDGYADLLVTGGVGVYLFQGSPTGPIAPVTLYEPVQNQNRFIAPAMVGDVNGDGFGDFVIGAPGDASTQTGEAFLYLGERFIGVGAPEWNSPTPTLAKNRINLVSPDGTGDFFGTPAAVGDINNDGLPDFVVSALLSEKIHVYLGAINNPAQARLDISSPTNGGFFDDFGSALSAAGDVNGDGYGDFIIGSWGVNPPSVYLYLGISDTSAQSVDSSWNGSSPNDRLTISDAWPTDSRFGYSGSAVGDLNGDNFADFIIGTDVDTQLTSEKTGPSIFFGDAFANSQSYADTNWNVPSPKPTTRLDIVGPDQTFGSPVF